MTLKPTALVKESSRLLRGSKTLGKPVKPGKLGRGFNTQFAKTLQDLAMCCNSSEILQEPPRTPKQNGVMWRLVRHPDRPSFRHLFPGVTVLVLVLQMT